MDISWLFAGIMIFVVVVVAVWSMAAVCERTAKPVFFMSEPTVVPLVSFIVPDFIGPENVVVPIVILLSGLSQLLLSGWKREDILPSPNFMLRLQIRRHHASQ
jgi:hypothetical protein